MIINSQTNIIGRSSVNTHRLVIKDAFPKNHRDTLLPTIDFYHTASKLQTQSQTERLAENEFLDHGGAANENVHMPVQAVPKAVL